MTITLNVPDMSCGHCIKAIESAVRGLDAKASVSADLDGKTVTVSCAATALDIARALDAAGYPNTPA
jgi:copper chaperone